MQDKQVPFSRSEVIAAVKTPLGFFALVVLVAEVIFGFAAYFIQGTERMLLVGSMIALIFLLVIIVAVFAWRQPEALSGTRPPMIVHAEQTPVLTETTSTAPTETTTTHPPDPTLRNVLASLSLKYRIVNLFTELQRETFGTPYAPIGLVVFHGVPFMLDALFDSNLVYKGIEGNLLAPFGHSIISVQPGVGNIEVVKTISANVQGVIRVHFLITAGHGWTEHENVPFLNRQVGRIELSFADGSVQPEPLILGQHLREWAFGNNSRLVRDIDERFTKPAWISHDNHYLLDMMSISIRNGPRGLASIKIAAKFQDETTKKIMLPAIRISAITCERAL